MHRILVILFLSAHYFGQAQVTLFEDYNLCLMGVKDAKGKVLYEAMFPKILLQNVNGLYTNSAYYILDTDGTVGLIDVHGKLIVPWEYEKIDFLTDSLFILTQNGQAWYYDHPNQIKKPLGFESVRPITRVYNEYGKISHKGNDHPLYFAGEKNGLFYLLDSTFQQMSQKGYAAINYRTYSYKPPQSPDDIYFETSTSSRKNGLLNYQGVEIVPCTGYSVNMFHYVGEDGSIQRAIGFQDSLFGMINTEGTQLIPHEYSQLSLSHALIVMSPQFVTVHYPQFILSTADTSEVHAYHMNTGKKQTGFDRAMMFENYVLFEDADGWGILDSNLNVVTRGNKMVPSIFTERYQGFPGHLHDHYWYYEEVTDPRSISPKFDVIFVCQPNNVKMRNYNGQEYPVLKSIGKRGIRNFKTGRQTPIKYVTIGIRQTPSDVSYWAMRPIKKEGDPIKLDVYNRKMRKIRTLKIDYIEDEYDGGPFDMLTNAYKIEDSTVFDAYTRDGKSGILNYRGVAIVPFEFDAAGAGFFGGRNSKNWFRKPDYLVTTKGQDILVYYPDGTPLFSQAVHKIHVIDSSIVAMRSDTDMDLYDKNLALVKGNISYRKVHPGLGKGGYNIKDKHGRNISYQYFICDDYLYMWDGTELILMDENYLSFKSETQVLFKHFEIDRTGKFLDFYTTTAGNQKPMIKFRNARIYYRFKEGKLSIFNDSEKELVSFSNVEEFHQCDDLVNIYTEKEHIVYDLEEPHAMFKFQDRKIVHGMRDHYDRLKLLWVRADNGFTYDLYNLEGEKIDSLYNDFNAKTGEITKRGTKFGLIDDSGNIKFPHEYDFIGQDGKTYYLNKNGKWRLHYDNWRNTTNVSFYDNISLDYMSLTTTNARRFVQSGNRYAAVSLQFDTLTPFVTEDSLLQHYDILELFLDHKIRRTYGVFETAGMDPMFRQLSNENFMRKLKSVMIDTRILSHDHTSVGCNGSISKETTRTMESETNLDIVVMYAHRKYYSAEEIITERHHSMQQYYYSSWSQPNADNQTITHKNYIIENGNKTVMYLKDLFANPETFREDLHAIMLAEMNEQQTFGLQCPNIDEIVAQAANDFTLHDRGYITVYSPLIPGKKLTIPKKRLLPYLADKKLFD